MTEIGRLLLTLQHADSFFPSGSIAFSYGLETAAADGYVISEADVERFLSHQNLYRWATFDRSVLSSTWSSCADFGQICENDYQVEIFSLTEDMREGSKRNGRALLNVHLNLGLKDARIFRGLIEEGRALGHLSIVQAIVWHGSGLSLDDAEMVSVHGLCVSVLGAAIRLGLLGHLGSQRIQTRMRKVIESALSQKRLSLEASYAFTPLVDIAVMRHKFQNSRLFSH